jgi:hypothetical protein
VATGASPTPPIVFSGVDAPRADRRSIERADISHASFAAPKVVQTDVDLGRSVDRDVEVFLADDVLRNDGAENR